MTYEDHVLISHFWEMLGVAIEMTQGVILKTICKMKTVNVNVFNSYRCFL